MDYLIRLVQMHEDFRLAEIRALASLASIALDIVFYSTRSPFLVVRILSYPIGRFASVQKAAETLVARSVLALGVYEVWGMSTDMGTGTDVGNVAAHGNEDGEEKEGGKQEAASYATLHADVRTRTGKGTWEQYRDCSFKFSLDAYCGKRSPVEQVDVINGFSYLGFQGPIQMQNPDVEFTVFEEWDLDDSPNHQVKNQTNSSSSFSPNAHDFVGSASPSTRRSRPRRLFFGRLIAVSARAALTRKHSLKTRPYISTTSMDATLALVTANIAQAGPGKLVYDPFVGTGGFLVAAAEFGAYIWGSDIDGRSFRGTGGGKKAGVAAAAGQGCAEGIERNFKAYGLEDRFGDCFISDITHSPLRHQPLHVLSGAAGLSAGLLDTIICDPPYGVREGLKVLGHREPRSDRGPLMIDGVPAHMRPGYIAPKKQYSFGRMLDDILAFAADVLVVHGTLAFWTPSADADDVDGDQLLRIPRHSALQLIECCVQDFRNWSRRLLVYRRREVEAEEKEPLRGDNLNGTEEERMGSKTASDLNPFRRKYFQGFQTRHENHEGASKV